jgi:hypothetical protein
MVFSMVPNLNTKPGVDGVKAKPRRLLHLQFSDQKQPCERKTVELEKMSRSFREHRVHCWMITSDIMSPTSLISRSLLHLLHFTMPSPCVKNAGVLHFAQLACFAAYEYLRLCRMREWMVIDSHGAADMRLAKPFGWLFTISAAHPLSSHAFTMASRSDVSDSGSFTLLISYVA